MRVLFIISLSALLFANSEAYTSWNSGAGVVYKLPVTQDVWLEGSSNKNSYDFIIVAKHPQYPNKRSLLQFESLPKGCIHIKWAKMYVYFLYAHKSSWQSVQSAPYISRTLQVYQVKKQWNEAQATSINRLYKTRWSRPYLALDGSDAGPHSIGSATVFTSRPRGFMEFDITEAMRNWKFGDPNYGVLLLASNEDAVGRDLRFGSKSNSDSSRRPFVNVLCD